MKLHKTDEQQRKKHWNCVDEFDARLETTQNGQIHATHVCDECALANLNKNLDGEKREI